MSAALSTAFLNAVLGKDGAAALTKAVTRQADLADVLVPRTVLSFVTIVQQLGYKGEIPGLPGTLIALTKSGGIINKTAFTGPDANAYTMAAHLAIMLGAEAANKLAKNTRDLDLTRFGKAIDLLVKSRLVRGAASQPTDQPKDEESVTKTDLPGTTAKPQLTPPIQADAPQKQPASNSSAKPSNKKPKPSVAPPRTKDKIDKTPDTKLPDLKIAKSDAYAHCKMCGQPQFRVDGGFYGCLCLRGLAPFTLIKNEEDFYTIRFGPEWDEDAREVLYETLHGLEG